jgi:hypothetical protein
MTRLDRHLTARTHWLTTAVLVAAALCVGCEKMTRPRAKVAGANSTAPVEASIHTVEPEALPEALDEATPTLDESRRAGWTFASHALKRLDEADNEDFPGIEGFLKNIRILRDCVDPAEPSSAWVEFDVDGLVSRNPHFWATVYEIAPGDPGIIIIHAGFLLSAGESRRASILLALTRHCPDPGEQMRAVFAGMHGQASLVLREGEQMVAEGVKDFDEGDREAALAQFEKATSLWPQNGLAHYETGLTILAEELEADGATAEPGTIWLNADPKYGVQAAPHFAAARRHDPLLWRAYQGNDPDLIGAILPLGEHVIPAWGKILADDVDDEVLMDFAKGCQDAELDELALIARQVIVARRGRFEPSDHPFIAKSLRRLAPSEVTEATLKRLAAEELPFRQLIKRDGEDWN